MIITHNLRLLHYLSDCCQ
uniref:Uncharacterized protein n=1 Tax=Arundo donax TaxID=35708 RepID=A0A0A9BLB2_ARUDO